jgi:hypothetical protein
MTGPRMLPMKVSAAMASMTSSWAAVSAQPLLGAVDFAVEASQPPVSAAAVSTTGSTATGADLRSEASLVVPATRCRQLEIFGTYLWSARSSRVQSK